MCSGRSLNIQGEEALFGETMIKLDSSMDSANFSIALLQDFAIIKRNAFHLGSLSEIYHPASLHGFTPFILAAAFLAVFSSRL